MTRPRTSLRNVWAVLPAKSFTRAKSRLRDALDDVARAALARQMFEHVLACCRECSGLAGTLVVTDDDSVAELAAVSGAEVLRDRQQDKSLASVIDAALHDLELRGADAALVLMTDLPSATDADLQALLAALADSDLVLAPDRAGRHTNALGLRLGSAYRTCFGSPNSLAEHVERAEQLGLRVRQVTSAGLAHDVDTPADLDASVQLPALSPGLARRNA